MNENVFIWRIDGNDTIIGVSDNWQSFADANGANGSLHPDNVLGRELWDFIDGMETRQLYRELFRRVREGALSGCVPFRCDAPGERRYLDLLVEALPDGHIKLTSTLLRTEPRDQVGLLDVETPRSKGMLTVCSMCKKIKVAPDNWVEIEEGLAQLRLFEADEMPQLSHGMCTPCWQTAMAALV